MDEADVAVPGGSAASVVSGPFDPTVSPMRTSDTEPALSASDVKESAGLGHHRTVPYGALAEERARRKGLQRELQNAIDSQQRLQGRLDLLHELAQQQGAGVEPAGVDNFPERVSPQEGNSPEEASVFDVDAQAGAQLRTQLMHSVRDAIRERPDFLSAYQHARQARVSELCALGYAPQDALAIAFDNEAEVISNAYATGRNPAQIIYDYARSHGYRGSSNAPRHNPGDAAPGRRVAMSEAEKVALAARGQAASKSLSAAGGGATGSLTLEALAGMSDDEFAEATRGDRWQKLLKG